MNQEKIKHPAEEAGDDQKNLRPEDEELTLEDLEIAGVISKKEQANSKSSYYERLRQTPGISSSQKLEINVLADSRMGETRESENINEFLGKVKERLKEIEEMLGLKRSEKEIVYRRWKDLNAKNEKSSERVDFGYIHLYDYRQVMAEAFMKSSILKGQLEDDVIKKQPEVLIEHINQSIGRAILKLELGPDEDKEEVLDKLEKLYQELLNVAIEIKKTVELDKQKLEQEKNRVRTEVEIGVKKKAFESDTKHKARIKEAVDQYDRSSEAIERDNKISACGMVLERIDKYLLECIQRFNDNLPRRRGILEEYKDLEGEIKTLEEEKVELKGKLELLEKQKAELNQTREKEIEIIISRSISTLFSGQEVSLKDKNFIEENPDVFERFREKMREKISIWPEDLSDTNEKEILFDPKKVLKLLGRTETLRQMLAEHYFNGLVIAPSILEAEAMINNCQDEKELSNVRSNLYSAHHRNIFYRAFEALSPEEQNNWDRILELIKTMFSSDSGLMKEKYQDKPKRGSVRYLVSAILNEPDERKLLAEILRNSENGSEILEEMKVALETKINFKDPLAVFFDQAFLETFKDGQISDVDLDTIVGRYGFVIDHIGNWRDEFREKEKLSSLKEVYKRFKEIVRRHLMELNIILSYLRKAEELGARETEYSRLSNREVSTLDMFKEEMRSMGFFISPENKFVER